MIASSLRMTLSRLLVQYCVQAQPCKRYMVQTVKHAILLKTADMMSVVADSGAGVSQAPQ